MAGRKPDGPNLADRLDGPGESKRRLKVILVVLAAIPNRESLEIGRAMTSSTMGGESRDLEDVCSSRTTTTT
jgi:hypothetical protein